MIPLMAYIRSVLRDEQRRDLICRVVWVLVLLMLLVWGWSYNSSKYGECTGSSVWDGCYGDCTYNSCKDRSGITWLKNKPCTTWLRAEAGTTWTRSEPCKTWFEDDPMMLSGFVTIFIGLLYSLLIDRNQIKLVKRLHDIAVINLDSSHWSEIRRLLKRYTRISYILTTVAAVVLTLLGFHTRIVAILCDCPRPRTWTTEFIVASMFCAVLVGLRLGRAIANGFTGRAIRKVSLSFEMVPQHPDGAGGLDSIGRFYLWQASGLLVPTVWLLIWIWIMSYMPDMSYRYKEDWLSHFQILLLFLTVVIWPVAVIAPMYSFHRLIVTWKAKHLEPRIVHVRTNFRHLQGNPPQSRYQRHRIRELFNYLYSLTALPDWPLSFRTLTVFGTAASPFLAAVVGSLLSSILK